MKNYGPWAENEVVYCPAKIAEIFIKKKKDEIFD